MDNKAVASLIHLQPAARILFGKKMRSQRIPNLLFHGIPHRTCAEFWMKSLADQKR